MTKLACLALLVTSTAFAQPRSTFTGEISYRECTTSFALACNKPDGRGGTYGDAHEYTHCVTYTFKPDGTYARSGDMPGDRASGRYRIANGRVYFTQGTARFDLALTGDTLGTLKRVR